MSVRELLALMAQSKKETLGEIDMNENETASGKDLSEARRIIAQQRSRIADLEAQAVLPTVDLSELHTWSLSHILGVMVNDSPRQHGRIKYYSEDDVQSFIARVRMSGTLTDAQIEHISDSIDWKDVELHYLAQIKFARAVLAAAQGSLK